MQGKPRQSCLHGHVVHCRRAVTSSTRASDLQGPELYLVRSKAVSWWNGLLSSKVLTELCHSQILRSISAAEMPSLSVSLRLSPRVTNSMSWNKPTVRDATRPQTNCSKRNALMQQSLSVLLPDIYEKSFGYVENHTKRLNKTSGGVNMFYFKYLSV
jgi:hypothetical protein